MRSSFTQLCSFFTLFLGGFFLSRVHITDLQYCLHMTQKNFARNKESLRAQDVVVRELDWAKGPHGASEEENAFDVIVASDVSLEGASLGHFVSTLNTLIQRDTQVRDFWQKPQDNRSRCTNR